MGKANTYWPLVPLVLFGCSLLLWGNCGEEVAPVQGAKPFLASSPEEGAFESAATAPRRRRLPRSPPKARVANRKSDLASALQQWFLQISQHTIGLLSQVRAIGQRLDEDTEAAVREMRNIPAEQPSEATASQVESAVAALGPVWTSFQEQEVMQMAARLRAFSTVMPPQGGLISTPVGGPSSGLTLLDTDVLGPTSGMGLGSEASFGAPDRNFHGGPLLAPTDWPPVGVAAPGPPLTGPCTDQPTCAPSSTPVGVPEPSLGSGRGGRWRKRAGGATERPSKSPRREPHGTPWATSATGLTPEGITRAPQTLVAEEDEEFLPCERSGKMVPWTQAWLHLLRFAVDNGADPVGEVSGSSEQDAVLPLHTDSSVVNATIEEGEKVWCSMTQVLADPQSGTLSQLYTDLLHVLHRLRCCSAALRHARQGVLVAAHITSGSLLDPFSYAPATAQEWLFPSMLLEWQGPLKGHIAATMAEDVHIRAVLSQPSPLAPQELLPGVSTERTSCVLKEGFLGCAAYACCGRIKAGTPCLIPALQQTPVALRDVAVFSESSEHCPLVLQVDERVQGALLFRWVAKILDLQWELYHFRRQVEVLPSIPPEQYVLSPWSLRWHCIVIPVDLRPIGGPIVLTEVHRNQPCGHVVQQAAHKHGRQVPADLLCRVGGHWFVPSACTLLLPCGDALQAWSSQRIPRSPFPQRPGSLSPRLSLENVFSTSLSLPTSDAATFHHASGHSAVVISQHGLHYAHAPSYVDADTIHAMVWHSYVGQVGRPGDLHLNFDRVLPPLANLPPVQFVVSLCQPDRTAFILDLRPLGEGILVDVCPRPVTPAQCLFSASGQLGDRSVSASLQQAFSANQLSFLQCERRVEYDELLDPGELIVLVVRLLSAIEQPEQTSERSSSRAALPSWQLLGLGGILAIRPARRVAWFGFVLGAASATFLSPEVPVIAPGIEVFEAAEADCPRIPPTGLASVSEHNRLASRFQLASDWDFPDWRRPVTSENPRYAFQVFAPGGSLGFVASGSQPASDVRQALLVASGKFGRQPPVPVQPQFLMREVQFVAPAREAHLVTILVDSGTSLTCLDVPKANSGPCILRALELLYPPDSFRLEYHGLSPLRHGDVVVAKRDAKADAPDLGAWSLAQRASLGAYWLVPHVEVYLTAPAHKLQLLRVPTGFTKSQLLSATLDWVGVEPTGHDMIRLPLQSPAVDLFCWLMPEQSTVAVILTDVSDCGGRPLVYTVAMPVASALSLQTFALPGTQHAAFWHDVLRRQPVVLRHFELLPTQTRNQRHFRFYHLGLDFCRAFSHGWSLTQDSRFEILELAQLQPEHFEPPSDSAQAAAFHDRPLLWPPTARPANSDALLKRRFARGCTPAILPSASGAARRLNCQQFGVVCALPCPDGFHVWAIRIGEWVRAACTSEVDWQHVLTLSGLTSWDMPDVAIHGEEQVWNWPTEIASLSGRCGHLLQGGKDPFVCDAGRGLLLHLGSAPNTTLGVPLLILFPHLLALDFADLGCALLSS
ncbi:unnamed protein product [Symbiodinium sp. CCMP2592]|nr:unnamed protein product [Symbiodinium sp. CCMP2592]